VLLLIPSAVILAVTGRLIFDATRPLPPIQPLPAPNGYDDFVKAGEMADNNTGDYYEMKLEELRKLVARNSDALQTARTNLQEDCAVPLQFSENYMSRHPPELADYKRLAQAFVAEGRLADMENRPGDAVKSYLDAIRLGNKSAHGGVLIDQLVGTAIEAMGASHLQKLVDQLDAKSCHETAAILETIDAQRQTWNEVMQQESAWSRRAFPGIKYRLGELAMSSSLKKAHQAGDKGQSPGSVADLVPDYLKAVPQDPVSGTNLVYSPR
jgi:hypothetical protein